jgi:hypothetical protein
VGRVTVYILVTDIISVTRIIMFACKRIYSIAPLCLSYICFHCWIQICKFEDLIQHLTFHTKNISNIKKYVYIVSNFWFEKSLE